MMFRSHREEWSHWRTQWRAYRRVLTSERTAPLDAEIARNNADWAKAMMRKCAERRAEQQKRSKADEVYDY